MFGGMLLALSQPVDHCRPPRELLPCLPPYPEAEATLATDLTHLSRSVRSRVKRVACWKTWANDGVRTLNSFVGLGNGGAKELPTSTSAAQRQALEFIGEAYSAVGPPPSMPAAAAFSELCGARAGYGMPDLLADRANYKAGHTSLPPTHSRFAEAERLLDGADLDDWVN